jgi:hypothetical protein
MPGELLSALLTLAGVFVGGLVSFGLQFQRNRHEVAIERERNKADFMAETTARHYLMNPRYTDRSFEMLQERLGGFDEDDLRRILVRAGAVRFMRQNGTEWWRLLERDDEAIRRQRARRAKRDASNSDA